MTITLTNDDEKRINNVYGKIETVTRPSLSHAIAYANAERDKNGKEGYWNHFYDINVLDFSKPFHRTVDGQDHTHFIIDVDIHLVNKVLEDRHEHYQEELRKLKIGAAIDFFKNWVADRPHHKFLWKVSGTGLHGIQKIDRKIDRKSLLKFVTSELFVRCNKTEDTAHSYPIDVYKKKHKCNEKCTGWHYSYDFKPNSLDVFRNDIKYIRIHRYKKIKFEIIIDLNYYIYDKKLIRWVYSPYFNIKGRVYFSVPIKKWDIDWIIEHSVVENIDIKPFKIPPFSFSDSVNFKEIDERTWQESRKPNINGNSFPNSYVNIQLFDIKDELPPSYNRILDRMTKEFDKPGCAPCLKSHFKKSVFGRGNHWNRYPILRFLMYKGYNIHQLANWIRFRLNQDHHNSSINRGKLLRLLPTVIANPNKPDPVPSCKTFQNSGHNFFICTEDMQVRCGRTSPLQEHVKKKVSDDVPKRIQQKIDNAHWNKIVGLVDRALESEDDLVIWKSTRAGVTTTMIYSCFIQEKKLLILVPTNKIAKDTFKVALNIVKKKTGRLINGAVLAKNDESCLELKLKRKILNNRKQKNPTWGLQNTLAWDKLMFRGKPSCSKCKFKRSTIELPILTENDKLIPLYGSVDTEPFIPEGRTGWCAYQTVIQNIYELDILVMTYSKMQTLRQSKGKENIDLLKTIMTEFDVLFLDEISSESQSSPFTISVLRHHEQPQNIESILDYDLFKYLKEELDELNSYSHSQGAIIITDLITRFIRAFEGIKLREWKYENVITNDSYDIVEDNPTNPQFQHPLTYQDRNMLREKLIYFHTILENYTKRFNQGLFYIEKILILLSYDTFFGNNLPSYQNNFLEYKFIVSPSILELRGFINNYKQINENVKIIATDACLPEANVSDLLNIPLTDYKVGDPRNTNRSQLIAADSIQIFPKELTKVRNCGTSCEFWDSENQKCNNTYYYTQYQNGTTWIQKSVSAMPSDGRCLKLQFRLMKDIQSIIHAYGSENVFIIFSNKKIKEWFIKWWLKKLPRYSKIRYSYYRSDLTIGVESNRRVMITVGSPIPPKNSYLWLAYYYHQYALLTDYSLSELAELLRINNMKSAYWQTIGRAKDPQSKIRSIVFSWGLSQQTLEELMNFNKIMTDSLPYHLLFDSDKYDKKLMLELLTVWKRHGIYATPTLIKFINLFIERELTDRWVAQRELYNVIGFSYQFITAVVKNYKESDIQKLGLHIKSKFWGGKIRYSFWYALTKKP